MFQLRNNLTVLLCAIIISSCGFIDLRPIGITITPDNNDSILQDLYTPLIIKFDTEMKKHETENILQVNSDIGTVSGDKFWDGNSLYFVPVQGWTAGVRHTLNLVGTIQTTDGRDSRVELFISFYAINKNPPPSLERHFPLNGSSIGTNNPALEFYFSCSMDKQTVESALSAEGIGNKTFEWSDEDKNLKVIPDKPYSPWTIYKWNLKESAKSADGIPLPKNYSGFFTTDIDKTLPRVVNAYPVLFSNGSWYPAGINLDTGLFPGYGIGISFNKPMGESVLRSIRFEPSLTGRTEYLSEDSVVYIFTRDPEPDTIFTLIVSGDTKDSEGLKIGGEYKMNFAADIPFLNVSSISADNGAEIINFTDADNLMQVKAAQGTGQTLLSINFSLMFGDEEKQKTPQRITLSAFFPKSLKPAALQYVGWISNDRLCMQWEGLTPPDDVPHYYKLVIPGGKGGISSNMGVYMKEDFILYLEVLK
ncbi:MAG: hypothetical protein FWB77_01105 [Treponema sp.]|nr:hypothetical protein [Treponema sp.]